MRYELGDRAFVDIGESTVEHDHHFRRLVRQAGIEGIAIAPGESPEDFAKRLLAYLEDSGTALPLLGCLLVPEPEKTSTAPPGESWTPEMGQETASFLGFLTKEKDKTEVDRLVISLLIHFFEHGIVSLRTSATSSVEGVDPGNLTPVGATAPGAS